MDRFNRIFVIDYCGNGFAILIEGEDPHKPGASVFMCVNRQRTMNRVEVDRFLARNTKPTQVVIEHKDSYGLLPEGCAGRVI